MQENWHKIEEIFHNALELPPDKQKEYVRIASHSNPEIYREVISLLKSSQEMEAQGGFLKTTGGDLLKDFIKKEISAFESGRRIGPYQLSEEISSGGMGMVFLAKRADQQFEKNVAVKIIKAGLFNSHFHYRFLSERQILANLEHPNICRLLDGGITEEGLPFLVMEYIEGQPVTEYCDSRKLTIEQRLMLFRKICSAVQYAHQNLIIHRDLKPGNILVTDAGEPKLLDFGIAKLLKPGLSELPAVTRTGERLFTPEYASPEQTRGETVTTASDIYSLGVLLYVLLTGHWPYPYGSGSVYKTEKVIQEEEPRRPSKVVLLTESCTQCLSPEIISPEQVARQRRTRPDILQRQISGDLSNILLKALRKNPADRYISAERFSEDIRRHLQGHPVEARKPTFSYYSGKFIRRHWGGVLGAAIVILSLLTGITAALWQNKIARHQRDLAVRTANTMIFDLAEGLSKMSGPTESRLSLLQRAAHIYEEVNPVFSGADGLAVQQVEAERMMSQTYRLLGEAESGLLHAGRAVNYALRLTEIPASGSRERTLLTAALVEQGHAYTAAGDNKRALQVFSEAVKAGERDSVNSAGDGDFNEWRAEAFLGTGNSLFYLSRLDSAAMAYQQAFHLTRRLIEIDKKNIRFRELHAKAQERLADYFYYSGHVEESCIHYRQALEIRKKTGQLVPNNVQVLRALSISMQNCGWCAEQEHNIAEAKALYRESISIQQRLLNNDPFNVPYATALMGGYGTLANILNSESDWQEASEMYWLALSIGRDFQARGISSSSISLKMAQISHLAAGVFIRQFELKKAEKLLQSAGNILENLRALEPENTDYSRTLAYVRTSEGDMQFSRQKYLLCRKAYQEALELRRQTAGISRMSHDRQLEAYAHYKLAEVCRAENRPGIAADHLHTAVKLLNDLKENGELSENSEGARDFLPAIQQALTAISP
ncbi:MAG: protein kinase [Calditrichia bacterium]